MNNVEVREFNVMDSASSNLGDLQEKINKRNINGSVRSKGRCFLRDCSLTWLDFADSSYFNSIC